MRKNVFIIILLFVYLCLLAINPVKNYYGVGCSTGTGHALATPDSVKRNLMLTWTLDTVLKADRNNYEYLVYPI